MTAFAVQIARLHKDLTQQATFDAGDTLQLGPGANMLCHQPTAPAFIA